jgi:RHS repeat-associated protein
MRPLQTRRHRCLVVLVCFSLIAVQLSLPAPVAARTPVNRTVVPAPLYSPPTQASAEIQITGSGFSPNPLQITVGTPVTWRNQTALQQVLRSGLPSLLFFPVIRGPTAPQSAAEASLPAAVTAPTGEEFAATLAAGATFTYVFNTPGTYTFYVASAPRVGGSIIVNPGDTTLRLLPIGNQKALLGSTLTLQLATSGGQPTRAFSVTPLPLPPNTTFDAQLGRFTFRPDDSQIGDYSLTFAVTDGQATAAETVNITVPPPDPNGVTAVRGRILDANLAEQQSAIPLVGATVLDITSGMSTTTDSNGVFTLSGLEPGAHYLEFDGSTANPPGAYGAYRAQRTLIAHVTNMIDRPIYIMKIDKAGETAVNPNAQTVVNNPNISVTLTIPARTVVDDAGQLFAGALSVSPVPNDFTPSSLPNTLDPSGVLTIQPMGLTFQRPAPIRFPNSDGLTPGSEVDIWSMDHELSIFFVAGKGRVTADGKWIETIDGGIRESSWHLALPPAATGTAPGDGPSNNSSCPTRKPLSSILQLADGCLESSIKLPAYSSLGEIRQLEISYLSDRAYPAPIIPFEATLSQRAAIPTQMQYQLRNFGGVTSGLAAPVVWNKSVLNENRDEPLRGAVSLNGANLPTGVYPYSIRLTNQYGAASVSSDVNGQYLLVNEQNGAFGAGWGLAGLQWISPQTDGDLLLVNGDGSHLLFSPSDHYENDFEGFIGSEWSTSQTSVTPLGSRKFLGQFGNQAITLNLTNLPPHTDAKISFDLFVINSWDGSHAGYGPDIWELKLQNGPTLLRTTFSNTEEDNHRQAYPQSYPGGDNAGGTGATEVDRLGYTYFGDSVYRLSFDVPHSAITLTLNFAASGLQAVSDESWGLDNVVVSLVTASSQTTYYRSPSGDYSDLVRNADNTYTRRLKDGTEYRFNAAGLQTALIDRNGNTTTYAYDSSDRLSTITDPVGLVTTFAYNGPRLGSVSDPMGRVTRFEHNTAGDLVKVSFPDESSRQFGYDPRHLMTSETDERGFVTTRAYDAYGRLVSSVVPGDITRSTSYAQKVGLLTDPSQGTVDNPAPIVRPDTVKTTLTDGENRTTTYTFGPLQSTATVVDPAGLKTTIARDADSNPTKFTYPSGQVINQSFDPRGNLLTVHDPNVQGTTTIGYEPLFNQPLTVKDPFNQTTTFTYDSQGNLTRSESPLDRTVRMAYNVQGLPTVMTDTLGTVATFGYDPRGNLTGLAWGSGPTARNASFGYTQHGYLQSMTDSLSRSFAYGYDPLGRLTSETLPGNRVVSYGYDLAGNLTSLTPPGRPAHQFEYDGLGQMTAYIPPSVAGVGNPRTSYEYNRSQQLTKITRPDGLAISYTYDSAGRLQRTQFARGALAYTYNPTTGQLTTISAPENVNLGFQYRGDLLTGESWSGALTGSVGRAYDAGYRTTSLSVNGAAITYQYDADHAPTRAGALTLGYQPTSGLLANTTLGSVNDSFGYNTFGELQSYRANVGSTPLFQTSYARDSLGRITALTETISTTTTSYLYGYDAAGRLERVTRNGASIATYSYDANGNRLSATDSNGTATGSYDDQDRLLSYGNATYSYSANGELQGKTVASTGSATGYSYDEFGNLTRVVLPGGETITYLIDGKDRRIGKRVNGVLQKGWLYEDQLRPVAELDGTGAVVSRFVYATRVNVPDYLVKGNITYRLVLDHLGSVRLVVNTQSGQVVQRMDYDAWGVVTMDTNPGFQPFGFAGGLYDGQTGLVRFGARDYDAGVGRWTTKDPIGFAGGDMSLYVYLTNDPQNQIDPSGECPWCVAAVVGALTDIGVQLLMNGCVDWKQVAVSAALSAVGVGLAQKLGTISTVFGGASRPTYRFFKLKNIIRFESHPIRSTHPNWLSYPHWHPDFAGKPWSKLHLPLIEPIAGAGSAAASAVRGDCACR